MSVMDDFCGDDLPTEIAKLTRNDIIAQVLEYYLANPSASGQQIADLFKLSNSTVSHIISSYFKYTGPYYEILVLQSKV